MTADGCHADKDGDCHWPECPQRRDGEPFKTGRRCPLDRDPEARPMKLSTAQTAALLWLDDHNGEGVLDRYGRVCAGGSTRPVGSWLAWLNLVAMGLVTGSDGRLRITRAGYGAAYRARTAAAPRAETKTIEQTHEPVTRKPSLDDLDMATDIGDEWELQNENGDPDAAR